MKKLLTGISMLTLVVLMACSANNSQPTPMSLSQIAIDTIVAVTMQAAESTSTNAPTALNTPASLTPLTMTPAMTASPSATPTADIPAVTPSPSAISGLPEEPSSISVSKQCPSGNLTAILTWKDTADDKTGYHIYRNGAVIVTLPAKSTTYTDTTTITPGTGVVYSVTAYNDAGESTARSASFLCK